MRTFRTCLVLCRTGIALFAACSALTGRLLSGAPLSEDAAWLVCGVFLLACGASALNQCQEREIDARMARTRHRPLPAGSLAPLAALGTAALLILAGLGALSVTGWRSLLLGVAALAWYNGIYTPLKARTAFAAVYGALVGAIPPAIGWTAGGGSLRDPRFLVLAMLFLLWQLPHFWLFLIRHDADYRSAGLPSLVERLGAERLGRVTRVWTLAAAIVPLALPLFGVVRAPFTVWTLLPVCLLMIEAAFHRQALSGPFRRINLHLAALMVLLSLDPVLRGTG